MYHINELCESNNETELEDGTWVRARPLNYKYRSFFQRLLEGYYVFIGKADAVRWTRQ